MSSVNVTQSFLRLLALTLLLPGLATGVLAEALPGDTEPQLQAIAVEQSLGLAAWEDGSADGSADDAHTGPTPFLFETCSAWGLTAVAPAGARRLSNARLPRAPPA